MIDSALKTSREIIKYGWTKDRTPVDTFIMGLPTSICERNDYEEKVWFYVLCLQSCIYLSLEHHHYV